MRRFSFPVILATAIRDSIPRGLGGLTVTADTLPALRPVQLALQRACAMSSMFLVDFFIGPTGANFTTKRSSFSLPRPYPEPPDWPASSFPPSELSSHVQPLRAASDQSPGANTHRLSQTGATSISIPRPPQQPAESHSLTLTVPTIALNSHVLFGFQCKNP